MSLMVNLLPTKRKLYQSHQLGVNRGDLNACRRSAWNRHPVLADAHMSHQLGVNRGGLTHADEVHGTGSLYMVSQLELKIESSLPQSFSSVREIVASSIPAIDRFYRFEKLAG